MMKCEKCLEIVPNHRIFELIQIFSETPDHNLCAKCWENLQNEVRLCREKTIEDFFAINDPKKTDLEK